MKMIRELEKEELKKETIKLKVERTEKCVWRGFQILFFLQNAMRATVEYHGVDDDLPDIKVYVVKGQEDLSIKVLNY